MCGSCMGRAPTRGVEGAWDGGSLEPCLGSAGAVPTLLRASQLLAGLTTPSQGHTQLLGPGRAVQLMDISPRRAICCTGESLHLCGRKGWIPLQGRWEGDPHLEGETQPGRASGGALLEGVAVLPCPASPAPFRPLAPQQLGQPVLAPGTNDGFVFLPLGICCQPLSSLCACPHRVGAAPR